jgi:hypothetical protein
MSNDKKRVAFTLDERSMVSLDNMTEPGSYSTMDTAEAFPSPDSRRIRVLETLILARTNLCPFGGGNVEGERTACKFGHPGCVCADVKTAEAFPDPLQQRVEELEAALRPFAAAYEAGGMAGHEGILVKVSLAVDWFEAAARALGKP